LAIYHLSSFVKFGEKGVFTPAFSQIRKKRDPENVFYTFLKFLKEFILPKKEEIENNTKSKYL
jgi:hypothetical protein